MQTIKIYIKNKNDMDIFSFYNDVVIFSDYRRLSVRCRIHPPYRYKVLVYR